MPKVSVNILTKNRSGLLQAALKSIVAQSYKDFEVVVVNDGSSDNTAEVISSFSRDIKDFKIIDHKSSLGISRSRQEALINSAGNFVAILDDDDEWTDNSKLTKQVQYLEEHPEVILVGGGIRIGEKKLFRTETDAEIRKTMLLRNNFFTSTVMFHRDFALKAGGFISDQADVSEDYDLWLRMGKLGQMHNFQEVFALYRQPNYNKDKFKLFLKKQKELIKQHRHDYPGYLVANLILTARIFF